MSRNLNRELIADQAIVVQLPRTFEPLHPVQVDRSFEMPTGVYVATAGCCLAFLAILATAFASPGLIIPIAVCITFIIGFFGVPATWTRMAPDSIKRPMGWNQFANRGIATLTGRLSAGEATVQMLILPVLVVMWAFAVATIAALI